MPIAPMYPMLDPRPAMSPTFSFVLTSSNKALYIIPARYIVITDTDTVVKLAIKLKLPKVNKAIMHKNVIEHK